VHVGPSRAAGNAPSTSWKRQNAESLHLNGWPASRVGGCFGSIRSQGILCTYPKGFGNIAGREQPGVSAVASVLQKKLLSMSPCLPTREGGAWGAAAGTGERALPQSVSVESSASLLVSTRLTAGIASLAAGFNSPRLWCCGCCCRSAFLAVSAMQAGCPSTGREPHQGRIRLTAEQPADRLALSREGSEGVGEEGQGGERGAAKAMPCSGGA
jgi:hypothetical protein